MRATGHGILGRRVFANIVKLIPLLLLITLVFRIGPAMSELESKAIPAIAETVVMLYYKDITAAASFYGETLGLEKTFDQDFAKLFRMTPNSVVGVILEGRTSYHRVQETNAVMLSIVTPDVDAWYDRLVSDGGATILKPIADSTSSPIRAFLVEDPGGYTVEFFSWLKTAESMSTH
ncbi:MAG: putative enzyme related to lactoylglutathione lyase [Halieaceae bacterium]|jgi:predicted enzyme related to lactoylglutathione lyase